MVFKPKKVVFENPRLTLNNVIFDYTECAKYLGIYIEINGSCRDIKRQLCKIYASSNTLISKFRKCSADVKCHLFLTFCTNMYCPFFWHNATKANMEKLKVAYNNSLRRFLKLPFNNSASQMFVCLNIPSFYELLRRNIHNFTDRLSNCDNIHVMSLYNNCAITFNSSIQKWWRLLLYV